MDTPLDAGVKKKSSEVLSGSTISTSDSGSNTSIKVNENIRSETVANAPTILSRNQEMTLRILNSIDGQLAILVNESENELLAIPLNFYNKTGKVILGIEKAKTKERTIWGAKYGHWAPIDSIIHSSPEHPLGLEILVSVNKLFVSEYFSKRSSSQEGKESGIYLIRNSTGDLIFAGKERINFTVKYLYGKGEQKDLKIYDPFKREVVFCRQLLRFANCLSSCCMQCMEVMVQPSNPIGKIHQKWSPFATQFFIEDQNKRKIFSLNSTQRGLCVKSKMFDILSSDMKNIGQIRPSVKEDKVSQAKEMPILSIEFKGNVSPIEKTILLSALFLIKYISYD